MSFRQLQRPEALALAGLGLALVLGVASVVWVNRTPEPVKVSAPDAPTVISVHVAGEVLWPGLYVLKAGSRVQDAMKAAHGPTLVADLKKVNLAAVLRDGDRVVIPKIAQPPYPYAEAKAEERRLAA
jgi:competence protein ComEA